MTAMAAREAAVLRAYIVGSLNECLGAVETFRRCGEALGGQRNATGPLGHWAGLIRPSAHAAVELAWRRRRSSWWTASGALLGLRMMVRHVFIIGRMDFDGVSCGGTDWGRKSKIQVREGVNGPCADGQSTRNSLAKLRVAYY